MSQTSLQRRRRILLHFLLGIGLPSLLLAYLAFRGIRNDIALLERERLNTHQAIAQRIVESFEERRAAMDGVFPDAAPEGQVSSLAIKGEQSPIEAVFLLDPTDRIRYLCPKLLFVPDGSVERLAEKSTSPALLSGQRYEFQQDRYREALASYQQAFAEASDRQVRAQALSALARVQKKSDPLRDERGSYETPARDYGNVRLGALPAELSARMELGTLALALGDFDSAMEALLDLYEDLVHGRWTLERSQYIFVARQLQDRIDEALSQRSGTDMQKNASRNSRASGAGERKARPDYSPFRRMPPPACGPGSHMQRRARATIPGGLCWTSARERAWFPPAAIREQTLVKQIVEAHGGNVHVESTPGRGSTFSIRLPIPSTEVQ